MPITNQFKPTPAIDLPFLNAWRDKIVETAHSLGIDTPEQRELIDFETLFEEIKIKRFKQIETLKNLDTNIEKFESRNLHTLAKKMKYLKSLVTKKVGSLWVKE